MNEPADRTRVGNYLSKGIVLVLLAVVVAFGVVHFKERNSTDNGSIEIDNVQLDVRADHMMLNANARVQLPPIVQTGLDSGVPLTFVVQFDLQQPSQLWFSNPVVSEQVHYTLTYYELTRHYRVNTIESDVSRNFRSLSAALAGLGELDSLEFELDKQQQQSLVTSRRNKVPLEGSLDMRLSTTTLPLSLQPIFRSSWKLVSEVYRWSIT